MLQNYKGKWSQSSFLGTSKTTLETKEFVHILKILPSLSLYPSFPFPFLLKWLYFNICNACIQWISNEIFILMNLGHKIFVIVLMGAFQEIWIFAMVFFLLFFFLRTIKIKKNSKDVMFLYLGNQNLHFLIKHWCMFGIIFLYCLWIECPLFAHYSLITFFLGNRMSVVTSSGPWPNWLHSPC